MCSIASLLESVGVKIGDFIERLSFDHGTVLPVWRCLCLWQCYNHYSFYAVVDAHTAIPFVRE